MAALPKLHRQAQEGQARSKRRAGRWAALVIALASSIAHGAPAPPTVTTSATRTVTSSSVTLNGAVTPNESATTAWFRYSTTHPGSCNDSFGTRAPSSAGTTIGSGTSAVGYSQTVTGLTLGATYYYCAIANNTLGTSFGSVQSFEYVAQVIAGGTFTKSTSGTATSQVVTHGMGAPPKAILFWTEATTADGFKNGSNFSYGFTDGTTAFSVNTASEYNAKPTVTAHGLSMSAIRLLNGAGTTLAEGTVTSWDASTFTVSWSVNDTGAYRIRFLAVGGDAVSAKVVSWLGPTVAGTHAVTGVGFQPTVVFHLGTQEATSGWPTVGTHAEATLGAMSSTGQWLTGYRDITGLNLSSTSRWQRTDRCISHGGGATYASLGSMNADGFSLSFGASSGVPSRYGSLALQGSFDLGSFTKPTASAPVNQSVTTSLRPAAVMLHSYQAAADTFTLNNRYLTLGLATSAGQGVFSAASLDNQRSMSSVYESSSEIFLKLGSTHTATEARATLTSLDASGFTLSWTQNDSVATQALYFAAAADTTTALAPAVMTLAVTSVGTTSATLNGTADPNLASATGYFRYSTTDPGTCTDAFGTRAPSSGGTALGAGNTAVAFSNTLTGLVANTTYYYCALATSSVGTSVGPVQSFTTAIPRTSRVGTFTKATGTPTASQTIAHGLGQTPKAILFWTVGASSAGFSSGQSFSYGFTDGTNGFSSSGAMQDGATASVSSKGLSLSPVRLLSPSATVVAEATVTSWDATGFTLSWTTNDASPTRIHFVAFGGDGVQAKVLTWQAPLTASTKSVTGVGFQPDVVFHVGAGKGSLTAPSEATFAHASLGVMSSAGTQWSVGQSDDHGASPTFVNRWNDNTATILAAGDPGFGHRATFLSMDSDGFSLSWTSATGTLTRFGSLALRGVQVKVGSFDKVTSGSAQSLTGFGFRPGTVFLASDQNLASAPQPATHGRIGLGASDGTASAATTQENTNGVTPTQVHVSDSTSAVFTKVNNGTQTLNAQATLTGFDADGLSFGWGTNDAVATRLHYVAFAGFSQPTVTTSAATDVGASTATLNASANPNGDGTTGWFRYGTSNPGTCTDTFGTRVPAEGGTSLGSGSAAVLWSEALTGLTPNTTYYFCALAESSFGKSVGSVQSFSTPAPPTVLTSAATDVTSTSGTLSGSAVPNQLSTQGWFRYSTTNPGTCDDTFGTRLPSSGGVSLGSGTSSVSYSEPLTGLTASTTYYFCAIAGNSAGTSAGVVMTFTTPDAPIVTTSLATSVGSTAATLNGSAQPNYEATTGWFRYSTTNPGTCTDSFGTRAPLAGGASLGSGAAAVSYSEALTGLPANTTYYFCALASNAVGTSAGAIQSFTTTGPPTVVTLAPSTVTSSGATLEGTADPNLDAATGYFRYGTTNPGTCSDTFGTRAPATGGTALGTGTLAVAFSQPLAGLSPSTTYYFCAIATNAVGMGVGAVSSFTTTQDQLAFTTVARTFVAGECANAGQGITVQLQDAGGNPLAAPAGGITFTAVSSTQGIPSFYLAPGCTTPLSGGQVTLPAGQDSVSLYYSDTRSGSPSISLTGTSGLVLPVPQPQTVLAGAPTQLVFTSSEHTFIADECPTGLRAITVQARDALGNPALALAGGEPFTASSTSSGTVTWYEDATCTTTAAGALFTIPEGSTSVSVYYQDTRAGTPALSISSTKGRTNPPAQVHSVIAGPAAKLHFVTPPRTFIAGDCPGAALPLTVALQDGAGNAVTAGPGGQGFSASSTSSGPVTWYSDAACTTAVGSAMFSIVEGSSTIDLFYVDMAVGTPTLSVSTSGLAGDNQAQTVNAPSAASVTTVAATNVTATQATLGASVTANGTSTTVWFRHATTNPGACDDSFGTRAPAASGTTIGDGASAVPVTLTLTSLTESTTYFFCAIAENLAGKTYGSVSSFTTPVGPLVDTLPATDITSTGATFRASVNPNGLPTGVWFRYGSTNPGFCSDTFGTLAPATPLEVGSGSTAVSVSQPVSLQSGSTYFVCALASSAAGMRSGAVVSFSTPAVGAASVDPTVSALTFDEGSPAALKSYQGTLTARLSLKTSAGVPVQLGPGATVSLRGDDPLRFAALTWDAATQTYTAQVSLAGCPTSAALVVEAVVNGTVLSGGPSGAPVVEPVCVPPELLADLRIETGAAGPMVGAAVRVVVDLTDVRTDRSDALQLRVRSDGLLLEALTWEGGSATRDGDAYLLPPLPLGVPMTFRVAAVVSAPGGATVLARAAVENVQGVQRSEEAQAELVSAPLSANIGCNCGQTSGGAVMWWCWLFALTLLGKLQRSTRRGVLAKSASNAASVTPRSVAIARVR